MKKYLYEVRFFRRDRQCGKSGLLDTIEDAESKAKSLRLRGEKARIFRCEIKDWESYK